MQPALDLSTQLALLFDRFEEGRPARPKESAELHLGDYHPSVQQRLLGLFAEESAQALMDACNVVRVLEGMGCSELTMPDFGGSDLLVVDGRRANGGRFRVAVARAAWSVGRATLARLLEPQLGHTANYAEPAPRPSMRTATPPLESLPQPVLHAPAPAPEDGELTLSGDCRQIPLCDLLQMLARNGRTGVIRLQLEGGPLGECCLTDGELTHALCHGYRGEEALVELMGVRGATFTFTREQTSERTIYRKAAAVIMDTVRLLDERSRN
jgi:hypothetical protein